MPVIKIASLMGLFAVIILLSGCETALGSSAASATSTVVPLEAAATEPASTPLSTPTATPLPPPSPTPLPPTPTPVPPSPLPTVTVVTPSPTPISLAPSAEGEIAPSNAKTLTGAWDFTFGVMSLTQKNTSVAGTYQWYGGGDSGRIQGVIPDPLPQFQGVWLSDRNPNSQGFLRWQLAADWADFSGTFEGGSIGGQWCGIRSGQSLPPGCGFSGIWRLRFGSPPGVTGQATLVQTGQTVRGTYVDSQGHTGQLVEGLVTVHTLTEARLAGTWRNDQGEQDAFEWRLDLTTGRTFQGRRQPGNSEWCGWREETSEPEKCGW